MGRPNAIRTADSAPALVETDTTIALEDGASLALRLYGAPRKRGAPAAPLVVHFHGGAFNSGGLEEGAPFARLLADAGAVVASVAYPLAPAHPFPQAIEAGYQALVWAYKQRTKLAGTGARLYVAGEEAGGNVAAAVALMARDRAHPPLAGQILATPMLDPCGGTASLRDALGHATCCKWFTGWQQYLRSPMDAEHPYAVPGRVRRMADLPSTLVLTGADDPMHDEALAYARRLGEAGIAVTSAVLPVTGWPASLCEQAADAPCACADAVGGHLRAFFAQPPATQVPS